MRRRFNIAGEFLSSGPNIENFSNATSAVFGDYDPLNPDLIIGEVDSSGLPGRKGRGRPKKYKTEAERLQALRERARRYYAKKVEDKKNNIKFLTQKLDKVELYFQTQDARRLNNGYSKRQRQKDIDDWNLMINKYPEFRSDAHKIELREMKYNDKGSTDKSVLDKINADKKALLEIFRNKYGY